MSYQSHSATVIEEWSHRLQERCAILVGPTLAVVQVISYLDQATGGRLSAQSWWFPLLTPILVAVGLVTQLPLFLPYGMQSWQVGQRRLALQWWLLGIPEAVMLCVMFYLERLYTDMHMRETEALMQLHLTPAMLTASIGLYSLYVTFVGSRVARKLKHGGGKRSGMSM